jgi:predicted homoserine dehydrogenase-like protein
MVTSFADGSKISFEQSIVANATELQGALARHVARAEVRRLDHGDRQAL